MPKKQQKKRKKVKTKTTTSNTAAQAQAATGSRKVWFWCIHCERAFESVVPDEWKRGWFIEEIGKPYTDSMGRTWYECPYDGCDGSPIDFIPWDDMREDDPSLPEKPEKDVIYEPCYDGFPDLSASGN